MLSCHRKKCIFVNNDIQKKEVLKKNKKKEKKKKYIYIYITAIFQRFLSIVITLELEFLQIKQSFVTLDNTSSMNEFK